MPRQPVERIVGRSRESSALRETDERIVFVNRTVLCTPNREERMGKPWPEPLAQTPEEVHELSRLSIQYVLTRDELWRFAEELERRKPARQGAVLRVQIENDHPLWETASRDPQEAARRQEEARQIVERLRERDPGGDIAL